MNTLPDQEYDPAQTVDSPQIHPADATLMTSFYDQEGEEDVQGISSPFASPFQLSGASPVIEQQQATGQQRGSASAATPPPTRGRRSPLLTIALVTLAVLVASGLLWLNVFAQAAQPLTTVSTVHRQGVSPALTPTTTRLAKPTRAPTQSAGGGDTWVPKQLPAGWQAAGLQMGDAIQVLRTADAFTDREMSLDYRSVGTRAIHGGTFTAATFVMTPAARQRFLRNDVRESSNALFDLVVNTQLIRLVVTPQPQLIQFARQGQQQFAWVAVAFQFWQSRSDPEHPQQRLEGTELDPATKQPRVHHMAVLLLRVSQQQAGNTPAMGGTGWLVSNYALDLTNPADLDIVQPV